MNGISRTEFLAISYFYHSQQPLIKNAMSKVKKGDELFNSEAKGLIEKKSRRIYSDSKRQKYFFKEAYTAII